MARARDLWHTAAERPAWHWWLACASVLLLCGLLPYLSLLGQLPWGADATRWVTDGSLENGGWWRWATDSKHFIGYRPITALSYVFNHATTGYATLGYRALDMAAHLAIGALLFALFRSWTGDRAGWGLVALVVVLGHPATEEVLPYLARRSYLLATCFALLALVLWARACRDRRTFSPWAPMVALAVALGVLSNELAYVVVPLLPVLAYSHAPDRGRWRVVLQLAPTVLVCALAAYKRFEILGSLRGGYQKRYFAVVANGRPMWREMREADHVEIAVAAWHYTLDPIGVMGADPLYRGAGLFVLLTACGWMLWAVVVRPLAHRQLESARVPLVLVTWMVGSTVLIVLSETWFWRQGYLIVVPLGLLMAWWARDLAHRAPGWSPRRRALEIAPWLGILAGLLWNAPYWGGMNNQPHQRRIRGAETVDAVRRVTADLEGPGLVWMVVPQRSAPAHMVRIWANRYGDDRQLTFKLLAHLGPRGKQLEADARIEVGPGGVLELVLDPEHFQWAATPGAPAVRGESRTRVDRLWSAGRRTGYLLLIDLDDEVVIEAPAPEGRERLRVRPGAAPLPRPR